MRIKNLTPTIQAVRVREIRGDGREYVIYIEPEGSCEIENMIVLNKEKLVDSLEIESNIVVNREVLEARVDDSTSDSDDCEIVEESLESESVNMEEKFICEICGAEFGSARGLASHKNRAHSD